MYEPSGIILLSTPLRVYTSSYWFIVKLNLKRIYVKTSYAYWYKFDVNDGAKYFTVLTIIDVPSKDIYTFTESYAIVKELNDEKSSYWESVVL